MPDLTSALNFVPTQPEYRVYRLRCRFVVGAFCSQEQVEGERLKASYRFVEDMQTQGWELADGNLELSGGPFPATSLATSVPMPARARGGIGPHARFGPAYSTPVVDIPTLWNTADWEYELSGLFVRKLMPTVATVAAVERLEARRGSRRGR